MVRRDAKDRNTRRDLLELFEGRARVDREVWPGARRARKVTAQDRRPEPGLDFLEPHRKDRDASPETRRARPFRSGRPCTRRYGDSRLMSRGNNVTWRTFGAPTTRAVHRSSPM